MSTTALSTMCWQRSSAATVRRTSPGISRRTFPSIFAFLFRSHALSWSGQSLGIVLLAQLARLMIKARRGYHRDAGYLTCVAADKGAIDCARSARTLIESFAAELRR